MKKLIEYLDEKDRGCPVIQKLLPRAERSPIPQWVEEKGGSNDKDLSYAILFDADILAWRAASATDGRVYVCKDATEFKYKKEVVKHLEKHNHPSDYFELCFRPDPLHYATHNIDTMIKACIDKVKEGKGEDVYPFFFLSGNANYRTSINPAYKEHRAKLRTPENLAGCKQYILTEYDAIMVEPYEADDLIGISSRVFFSELPNTYPIICTIDKDLKMIPAAWLNMTDLETDIDWNDSAWYLYHQILTGDRTDNIEGLKGIGPKKADATLEGIKKDDANGLAAAALDKYFEVLGKSEDTLERFMHTANQIFILRKSYEFYQMPVDGAAPSIAKNLGVDTADAVNMVEELNAHYLDRFKL